MRSRRRRAIRKALIIGTAVVVASGVGLIQAATATVPPPAQDPIGSGTFQLDGNATTESTTPISDDWANVYCQVSQLAACATPTAAAGGTQSVGFVHATSVGATNFATNSKDTLDLSSWAWNASGGLPAKDGLNDDFAARYTLPAGSGIPDGSQNCPNAASPPYSGNCSALYFGSDRISNSGDSQEGFWLFQNPVFNADTKGTNKLFEMTCPIPGEASCSGVADGTSVPAKHRVGDILIVTDFSNGGTTSTINAYEWVASGGDAATNLKFLGGSQPPNAKSPVSLNCASVPVPSPICGIVNPTAATSPWSFTDGKGNTSFQNGEFFEGGLNLSQFNLGSECFAAFSSETRSSVSVTSTLQDFILGRFAPCTSTTATTAEDGSGTAIPSTGISIGGGSVTVEDSATVTGSGSSQFPTGNVDFRLCGDAATSCSSTTGVDLGTSSLGGTTNPATVTKSAVITAAGNYCFHAQYAGDTNFPGSGDNGTHECFKVNPVTPTLSTTASSGPVSLGSTISDTASLTGTANQPATNGLSGDTPSGSVNGTNGAPANGTITFNVYGPDDPTCANGSKFTGTATVSGDSTSYSSGTYTPKSAGTYYWTASYNGSAPNTNGKTEACGGAGESVVVSPNQPAISTVASSANGSPLGTSINDQATLSGTYPRADGTAAGGSIVFTLYGPDDSTCSKSSIFTSTVSVSGDGKYTSGSFTPTSPGTYYWTADYSGDLPNTKAVSEACGGANESSLLIQLNPSISTTQSFVPNDSATVTVPSGAGNLQGNVDFKLYVNDSTCTVAGDLKYDSGQIDITTGTGNGTNRTVSTNNISAYSANGTTTFNWLVTYTSTNHGQTSVTSSCSTENSSLTISGNGVSTTGPS